MKRFGWSERRAWLRVSILLAPLLLIGGCGGGGGSDAGTAKSPEVQTTPPRDGATGQPTPSVGNNTVTPDAEVGEASVGASMGVSRDVPDVASVPGVASGSGEVAPSPEQIQVDLESRRVYLPGQGWLDEDQFWEIYYHDPRRLPAGFDPLQLSEMGYREDSDDGGGTTTVGQSL